MSDITLTWAGTFADFAVSGGDLVTGNDLYSAVLISLFTDRVLDVDETPANGSGDPRGHWTDAAGQLMGSRLWTLLRAKRTDATARDAEGYATEALQWLIDDGVAARVDVAAEWSTSTRLSLSVDITRQDDPTQVLRFAWAWADFNY